jgi:hypothetical protein
MDATPKPLTIDAAFVQLRELQGQLLEHAIGLADRIAAKAVRRYSWLCADDLRQELLIPLPRWIDRYNPKDKSGTSWSKYLYHKMNFYLKDVLRREDPVGIKWPQREQYPTWFRLGDQSARLSISGDDSQDESLTGESGYGSDCPDELLGKTLEISVELSSDEDDQIWQRDLAGLLKLAKQNRKRKQYQLLVDAGNGVARVPRCEFWDSSKSRVRFAPKKVVSLASWVGHSRSQLTFW